MCSKKYKLKISAEDVLKYFVQIYNRENVQDYIQSFSKEIKNDLWKYLDLIIFLLKLKENQKVLFNKKAGIIEKIDFKDKKYRIKMEDESYIALAFILAPDKLKIIEEESEEEKEKYFSEPILLLKKIEESKFGIDLEELKTIANTLFGEKSKL